jgi:hypothetical protein
LATNGSVSQIVKSAHLKSSTNQHLGSAYPPTYTDQSNVLPFLQGIMDDNKYNPYYKDKGSTSNGTYSDVYYNR